MAAREQIVSGIDQQAAGRRRRARRLGLSTKKACPIGTGSGGPCGHSSTDSALRSKLHPRRSFVTGITGCRLLRSGITSQPNPHDIDPLLVARPWPTLPASAISSYGRDATGRQYGASATGSCLATSATGY